VLLSVTGITCNLSSPRVDCSVTRLVRELSSPMFLILSLPVTPVKE